MDGRVSKPWTRRPRVKLSRNSQRKLLDAVTSTGVEYPPIRRDRGHGTAPVCSTKRQLDATIENDPSPNKRPRLTQTHPQRPELEDSEQAAKTILQQPEPTPSKRSHASFLEDFVDTADPNRAESIHTFVSEWIESIGSSREKRCRSDSYLGCLADEPISRHTTRSAPEMSYMRDADGFMVPWTPASTGSRSYQADTDAGSVAPSDLTGAAPGSSRSSVRSLVENPLYRDMNLAANNIYLRDPWDPVPEHITSLLDSIRQDRNSPGPSADEIKEDKNLYYLSLGAAESKVERYFHNHIFPDPKPLDSLERTDRQPMAKHTVPTTRSKLEVSTPVPDMLYGYSRHIAFPQQQSQLISMGTEMVATNQAQSLLYPFFVIEFKGDGGSMWVATNQCLGGAASCVNIAERLNAQLRNCSSDKAKPISSAAFSIAMNGTEARLYISWKHDEMDYYMANIESFLLQKPADFIEFRKYVMNIID